MASRVSGRDERGGVAIMVALVAVVLLATAALAVDLGRAFVQKHAIQKRSDFAALAGGAGDSLPASSGGGTCVTGSFTWTAARATDQAVIDAAEYFTKEQAVTITPAQLVDCDLANGEANFGTWKREATGVSFLPNQNQFTVISPQEQVDFGMAGVLGYESVDVAGQATVEIKSQLLKTLPLYAFTGCDFGPQTIAQPTNGHSSDGVNLIYPDDKNTHIVEATLITTPSSTLMPPVIQLNSSTATVTISGENLDKVTKVGFFQSSATPAPPVEVLSGGFTITGSGNNSSLTVAVPTTVTSVQDVWFVRVYGPSGNGANAAAEWTPVTRPGNANKESNLAALPFTVGSATLTCGQGSSEGNFGTLNLYNDTTGAPNGHSDNIAYNIAYGLQYGLAPYPKANWTPPDYECVEGQDGVAKEWPQEGTNCVTTKTGLDSAAAEKGFVTGIGPANKALLRDTSPDTFCPQDRPTGTTHLTVTPTGHTINNDVLSCFFLNDSVTVADVSNKTYTQTGPVIDQSIYDSPRFVLIPVLGRVPVEGTANNYEIVDFRPGFITDQPMTANRVTGAPSSGNGLVWTDQGKLQAVTVIFLNNAALPDPPLDPDGKFIPWTGSGGKSLLLVD